MIDSFSHYNRDFVFMIDTQNMRIVKDISRLITKIFDEFVERNDRVCLMKYGSEKYTKTIFSLVEKQKNYTQLKNQFREQEAAEVSQSLIRSHHS